MSSKSFQLRLPVVAAVLGTAALVAVGPAAAKSHKHHKPHGPKPVYVSLKGSANKHGKSCKQAKFNSIQAAIEAAKLKSTVVVCKAPVPAA